MEYIELLKETIELLTLILGFAPLATEMPVLLPLAGLLAALLWLNQNRNPKS